MKMVDIWESQGCSVAWLMIKLLVDVSYTNHSLVLGYCQAEHLYNIYINNSILSRCLPVYPSTSLLVNLSTCLPVQLSTCLSVYLPICLPVYMSTCLLIYPSTRLSFFGLSVYLTNCLPVFISICLPFYMSKCLSVSLSF